MKSHNPFQRRHHDPKLSLLRRADTERESAFESRDEERRAGSLHVKKPITLPRVRFLEKPDDEEDK